MALTLSQQLAKFPERILREGYVFKESRHWGSWRKRWLVLFKDMAGLPVLLTFKVARADWSAADRDGQGRTLAVLPPPPTETVDLWRGATCMACRPDDARGSYLHTFVLHTRERDFFLATDGVGGAAGGGDACRAWVHAISKGIAEATLALGGHSPSAAAPAAAADPWHGLTSPDTGTSPATTPAAGPEGAPPPMALKPAANGTPSSGGSCHSPFSLGTTSTATPRLTPVDAEPAAAAAAAATPAPPPPAPPPATEPPARPRVPSAAEQLSFLQEVGRARRESADESRTAVLEEQNRQLLALVQQLQGSLDEVAVDQLVAQLEELAEREAELTADVGAARDEAAAARAAYAEKRAEAEALLALRAPRPEDAAAARAAAEELDAAAAGLEEEVRELEGELSAVTLQAHIMRDQINQLTAHRMLDADSDDDDEEEAYVPFDGGGGAPPAEPPPPDAATPEEEGEEELLDPTESQHL